MNRKTPIDKEMVKRLNMVRHELKLSVKKITYDCGISRQMFYEIFGGRICPKTFFVIEFCKKYKVNADWLLLGRGEEYECSITN